MLLNELAEKSGMTKDTLRYYEKIGLLPMVSRDHQGRRRYPVRLLEWLRFLQQMKSSRDVLEGNPGIYSLVGFLS